MKSLANEFEAYKSNNTSNTINNQFYNASETIPSMHSKSRNNSHFDTVQKEYKHTHTKSYYNPIVTANSFFNPAQTSKIHNKMNRNEHSVDLTTKSSFMKDYNIKFLNNEEKLLKKIENLEYEVEKRKIDFDNLKTSHELFQDKLKAIERKYFGIFLVFDEGLKQLSEEVQMSNSHEIYINVENINNMDFKELSSENKFSILLLLMKKILPLVKIEDLEDINYLKLLDRSNVKIKYHMNVSGNKKKEEDPKIKRYFANNNISSKKVTMDILPFFKVNNNVNSNGRSKEKSCTK